VIKAAPDILLVGPCGYTAEEARDEYRGLSLPAEWNTIPAVRNNRVYALEANSYWSRPGPRLMTGIAAMAKVIHPEVEIEMLTENAVLPIPPLSQAVTA
jgi:iron complex transport system substrate-binding protein